MMMAAGCGPAAGARAVLVGSASPTTVKHPSQAPYDPQASQTFLVDRGPSNWNPHSATAGDLDTVSVLDEIVGPVLPSAFIVHPDYRVTLNTTFVQSAVMTSSTPQTVVYQINSQATWSDGVAVSYQDFVYNWQQQSGDTEGYRQIASVSEMGGDPYRVSVVFATPYQDWRSLFSLMIPAHVGVEVGFDSGFTDPVHDVSAGPFEIQSYVPGISITLVRNPRYWGSPAHLASITFRFVTEASPVVASFDQGEVDAGSPRPANGLATQLAQVPHLDVAEVAGPAWDRLDLNEAGSALGDVTLRRAIMTAVDRRQLIHAALGRQDLPVRPLNNLVFVSNQPGYRNDGGSYGTGNVAAAKTALEAAGYTYSGATLLRSGQPVTLRIATLAGDALRASEEHSVVVDLERMGITVTEGNSSDLTSVLRSGNFDLAIYPSTASPFLSSVTGRYQSGEPAGEATVDDGYHDPVTDSLIAQAQATTRLVLRQRAFEKVDVQLWTDAVSLPLFQVPVVLAFNKRYLDIAVNPAPGGPTWNIGQWGAPPST